MNVLLKIIWKTRMNIRTYLITRKLVKVANEHINNGGSMVELYHIFLIELQSNGYDVDDEEFIKETEELFENLNGIKVIHVKNKEE